MRGKPGRGIPLPRWGIQLTRAGYSVAARFTRPGYCGVLAGQLAEVTLGLSFIPFIADYFGAV
jgi:hypothetical protein